LVVKNGIKTVKATRYKGTPLTIDDNPEESLVYLNTVYDNNNDKCIRNMVEYYQINFTEDK
ncbi:TPA: glycosyl transferase, partial [Streptococcus pneumoniae]